MYIDLSSYEQKREHHNFLYILGLV